MSDGSGMMRAIEYLRKVWRGLYEASGKIEVRLATN